MVANQQIMSNIVLVGMRGSGKSTVGKLLAEKLGKTFVETDALIVQKAGKSIPEIVSEKGWDYFRDLESEAIREVSRGDNEVISTGGGAILRPENVAALKRNGMLVYLRASLETLRIRIAGNTDRPSLTGTKNAIDEMEEILLKRSPIYESTADIVIDTDTIDPESIATIVIEKMSRNL